MKMSQKIPRSTFAFIAALLSLASSLHISFKSEKVSLMKSEKASFKSENPPCLVCHTLHIRSCNPPGPPAPQTFNSRIPRLASATSSKIPTLSMWPEKVRSLHLVSGGQAEPISSECADEPGCGEGGRRTVCKIRSLFICSLFHSDARAGRKI